MKILIPLILFLALAAVLGHKYIKRRPSSKKSVAYIKKRPVGSSKASEGKSAQVYAGPSPKPKAKPEKKKKSVDREDAPEPGYRRGLDLSRVVAPPEVKRSPCLVRVPKKVMDEITTEARRVGHRLQTRQAVLQRLSSPVADPRELTGLVLGDPALAAEILKTVNSPFYGFSQKIASVFRAVVLLGHVEVRSILWRACVAESRRSMSGKAERLLDKLWKHSFATSRLAYAIAKQLRLSAPDEVSTAALLHDIGKHICWNVWPDVAEALYWPIRFSDRDLLEAENRLGVGHAILGAEIAKTWKLPETTCLTIKNHHAPSYIAPDEVEGDAKAVAVVYLADVLCHTTSLGDHSIYLPTDGWLKALRIKGGLEGLCTETVMHALHQPEMAEV